ncbi:uncharacterized protein FIESC28_05394 [Fusarium coffeatum]|uniref:Uncharacterized protein n=1 Tax=Fusarium coffeatum TaxID=231269 RepID=A0A366RUW6_9HYPO|nr:uncharacterized protein FIESC28_05394 [Fusarium coffeatum]RBR20115.1 hypothetical protein FIESC28_05394 [Fusarium coffeatum]
MEDKDQKLQELQNECAILKKELVVRDAISEGLGLASRPPYLCHLESISEHGYHEYIGSPEYCHKAIQAFIWRVIVEEVLSKFESVGRENSKHFLQLSRYLQPARRNHSGTQLSRQESEAERKFHTWRATTTGLFLEHINTEKVDSYIRQRASQHAQEVINALHNLIDIEEVNEFKDQLATIIYEAFELDREVSRQSACVTWQFRQTQHEKTSGQTQKHGNVGLVISPAVLKRGKSTGECFDQEMILLRAEIDFRE